MARRSFLEPRGELDASLVFDALLLAGIEADPKHLDAWTPIELLIAYDFAIREHLRAGDNLSVRRRPKPHFVALATLDEEHRTVFPQEELDEAFAELEHELPAEAP